MARKKLGVPLNPEATREGILKAALSLLAERGPEGVSFSEVARLANVDRGTAHRHFETREELLKATAKSVADQLHDAVFGNRGAEPPSRSSDVMEQNGRLLNFAMRNPELCRVWLFEALSSADPATDPFWKAYHGSYQKFAATDAAQDHLNTEVLAVFSLAATFLWPIWIRAHAKTEAERRKLADSFYNECLRLSMFGSIKPEFFPEIAEHLKTQRTGDDQVVRKGRRR